MQNSLLFRQVDLEANDIAILDLAFAESKFAFHEFDEAWFNFLCICKIARKLNQTKWANRYLEEFQRSSRRPAHLFVDDWDEIANFTCSVHVHLSSAMDGLFRRIKVLKEYNNRIRRGIRLAAN